MMPQGDRLWQGIRFSRADYVRVVKAARVAEKAAPLVQPKPAPTHRLGKIELPARDRAEGVSAALGKLIQAVATGNLAASEVQSVAALIEA